jgi:hypothetical protein
MAAHEYYEQYVRDHNYYGADEEIAEQFISSLRKHIFYVQTFGEELSVPVRQLNYHDISKYSESEFVGYAYNFHGTDEQKVKYKSVFARSWLHHLQTNPHHRQSYIFPDNFHMKGSDMEGNVLSIPENYALEMVADWMSASMCYTGSSDMNIWLNTNASRILLHSKTFDYVNSVLKNLGYENIQFKHST